MRICSSFSLISFLFITLAFSQISLAKDNKDQKNEEEKMAETRFEKLELFNKVLYLIESQYYRKVSTEKLIAGAVRGMMNTLDPHSAFLDEEVFEKMQQDTKGEFGGIGIEISQKDGVVIIVTAIEDTPAYKAGLMAGDKIVEINYEQVIGMTLEETIGRMKGKNGTKITLGVLREGEEKIKRFSIKRQIIKINPVKHQVLDNEYLLVRLIQFQKNSAKAIEKALKKNKNLKGIILDLRSNPGGLLDEAVNVSSLFLKDGVVVSTEGRDPKHKEIRYVRKTGYKDLDVPLVVLVNGSSASASEIVAGALQDKKRAIVMGTRTFGKGSVQTVAKVDNKNGIKLTIAQYMTPLNRKIQAIGIEPDIKVEEFSPDWQEKLKDSSKHALREKDLKNHLTATLETKEEEKRRLAQEKKERQEKAQKTKNKKKLVKNNPKNDYQVLQALKYLKAYRLIKQIK